MGFFLETLFGGLMAGMLYSLVALGFVLIYKASGVFNFAQGAMVLFAALAMARFAEWIPLWLGFDSLLLANLLAFIAAMLSMVIVAWLIERLALRGLVNQEGITLLMATLGIGYFLDGAGQLLFGSATYKIDIGMPKDPMIVLENVFAGGLLLNKEDLIAAAICRRAGDAADAFLPEDPHRPGAARGGGRPPGGPVHRHSAGPHLGRRLVRRRHCGAGGGNDLGLQAGRAVFLSLVALKAFPVVILGGLTSVPGAILGGLSSASGKSCPRFTSAPLWAEASRTGSPMCWPSLSCWSGHKACSATRSLTESDFAGRIKMRSKARSTVSIHVLPRKWPVQKQLPGRPRSSLSRKTAGPCWRWPRSPSSWCPC